MKNLLCTLFLLTSCSKSPTPVQQLRLTPSYTVQAMVAVGNPTIRLEWKQPPKETLSNCAFTIWTTTNLNAMWSNHGNLTSIQNFDAEWLPLTNVVGQLSTTIQTKPGVHFFHLEIWNISRW